MGDENEQCHEVVHVQKSKNTPREKDIVLEEDKGTKEVSKAGNDTMKRAREEMGIRKNYYMKVRVVVKSERRKMNVEERSYKEQEIRYKRRRKNSDEEVKPGKEGRVAREGKEIVDKMAYTASQQAPRDGGGSGAEGNGREGEREGERKRRTQVHAQTHKHTKRETNRERKTQRDTETQKERQRDIDKTIQRSRHRHKCTNRHKETHTRREKEIEKEREKNAQKEKKTQREGQKESRATNRHPNTQTASRQKEIITCNPYNSIGSENSKFSTRTGLSLLGGLHAVPVFREWLTADRRSDWTGAERGSRRGKREG